MRWRRNLFHRLGAVAITILLVAGLTPSGAVRAQDAGLVETEVDGGAAASADAGAAPDGDIASSGDGGGLSDAAAADGAVGDGGPRREKVQPLPEHLRPEVTTTLGSKQVELGDVVPIKIDVKRRPRAKVHLRDVKNLGEFHLVDRRRSEKASDGGEWMTETLELDLISFETGDLEVPSMDLMVVLGDGQTGTVATDPQSVRITDPLANEHDPQPRNDHSPTSVMTTDRRALWAAGILGAMALAMVLGLVIGRLNLKRKPKPGPPPPPPRPPEEVALEKLEAIERSDWLDEGEIKKFHIGVSEAVREYLGGRYGFDSLEMTTEELMSMLNNAHIRGISRVEIDEFLRETDMVKFAKWRPDVEKSKSLLARGYDIVRRTTAAWIRATINETPLKDKPDPAEDADEPKGGSDAS